MTGNKLKLLMAMLLFLSCKTFLFGQSTDLLFSSDPGADDLTDPYAQYQITLIEGEKKAMVGTYEFAIGSGTTKYYMQIYDLSQIALDQIYSGVNSMNDKDLGAFSPNSYSPRFRGLTFTTAITDYESLWGENVLAMMNSAFLEDADVIPLGKYNHTTSFPVKVNGNLVTGGSSLFGPGSVNCPGNFCGTLRALVWNNGTSSADIVDYNHTSGSPLSSWENAIVSYKPENHPASAGSSPNPEKIHLVATNGGLIFILSAVSAQEPIPDVSEKFMNILQTHFNFNGTEKLISLDGGSSTFLRTKEQGNLVEPFPKPELNPGLQPRDLAFYLGVREKGTSPNPKKIIVRSPSSENSGSYDNEDVFGIPRGQALAVDSTFYVMYEHNLPLSTNVKIELYYNTTTPILIRELAESVPSSGVYTYTPTSSDLTCAFLDTVFFIKVTALDGSGTYADSDPFKIEDPSGELIRNGDFECAVGNTFTTEYTESLNLEVSGEGKYGITDTPTNLNQDFGGCEDNTPKEGSKMMAINGFLNAESKVWEQTVPGSKMNDNTDYTLGFSATNLSPRNATTLELLVDDQSVGTLTLDCDDVCNWKSLSVTYTSNSTASFTGCKITIKSLNEFKDGHDFAIDDISLRVKKPEDVPVDESASACLELIQPTLGGSWEVGDPVFIRWNDNILEKVKIELVRDGDNSVISTIVGQTDSDGEYEWTPTIADVGDCGSNLLVRISQFDDPNLNDVSGNSYTLLNADTTEAVPCGCSVAQNSSFEGTPTRNLPPTGWSNCFGTPDTMPEWEVTVQAFDGNTYAGLVTVGTYQEEISQYINLNASQTYDVSLYLAKADNSFTPNYASSATPTSIEIWAGTSSCAENILIWTSPTISSSTWTQYSFDFTPSQNYSYLKLKINSVSHYGNMLIDLLEICESDGMMGKNQVLASNSFETQQNINYENTNESKQIIAVPNPFSDYVEIAFPSSLKASNFDIYDLTGKLVKSISLRNKPQTERENFERSAPIFTEERVLWYGDDQKGGKVSPGIYIYSLKTKYKKEYTGKLVYKPN